MIFRVYSIQDRLSGFQTPVLEQSDPVAMRNFAMACDVMRKDTSVMAYRPGDFCLYHIADFDTSSGVVSPVVPVELVCSGSSLKEVLYD